MDIEKIIAEVLRRLETEIVSNAAGKRDDESKAKVLLISKERSRGHHLSEKINTLQAHYSIEYAEDTCLKDAHQIVIIADLDDSGLAKVTSGIFDEAYLAAMHEAMLKGKDILLNKDSLEIFRNKDTAPFAFFKFYEKKLEILEAWGIQVLSSDGIMDYLKAGSGKDSLSREIYGRNLMKRVVTDRDIRETLEEGQKVVTVLPHTIITDIAKETAAKEGVDIVVCKE